MKKIILALLLFSFVAAQAQNKLFDYSDYMNRKIYPKSISNLQWRGSQQTFTYIDNNALIQKRSDDSATADTLLQLDALNQAMDQQAEVKSLRRFPGINWLDDNRFYYKHEQHFYIYNFADSTLTDANSFQEDADNLEINTKTLNVAYTIGSDLYVSVGGKETLIEKGDDNILYGHVPSRNEFGINQGSFWSADGSRLAFYRIDQTDVSRYPLVDLYTPVATASPICYPTAGGKSQKVKLGIYNLGLNEITYLNTSGSENQYLTSVTWAPDGKSIYVGILNRDQNYFSMNQYDASTGQHLLTLFTEQNERYVEPQHDLYFLPGDAQRFIWQSRRDGWNHLYLYQTDGKLVKQITTGEWEVTDLLGLGDNDKMVYYESTAASPLERQLYATSLSNGRTTRLTQQEGVHTIMASHGMMNFLDIFSSIDMARAYYLLDNDGKIADTLLEDANPWQDYAVGKMEIFSLKADDGETDLWCRLIKPVDFDPTKKYPALVYVYGGPHAQLIDKSWTGSAGFWLNLMAQQGYVVFTLDNRGSANRGFAFESAIHRQCGEIEMADQMTGVEYLKSLPYVDQERMGIDGWSYGGFMTMSMFLRHPGIFEAACAGGPVIDWKWYEVMYGERYMDTPMQNPEGYRQANLLNYADQIDGHLLMIHGTNDPVVIWQNSLMFLDAAIENGKQVEYFVYPGAEHNMGGKARAHLFEKIATFFNNNLK
ncbi:MAG: S9 family peptidase [Clostridia bacterium]|nr:S9 family peptidase [Clostridia bacterium]